MRQRQRKLQPRLVLNTENGSLTEDQVLSITQGKSLQSNHAAREGGGRNDEDNDDHITVITVTGLFTKKETRHGILVSLRE